MIGTLVNSSKHLTDDVDWDREDDRAIVLCCDVVQSLQISQLKLKQDWTIFKFSSKLS